MRRREGSRSGRDTRSPLRSRARARVRIGWCASAPPRRPGGRKSRTDPRARRAWRRAPPTVRSEAGSGWRGRPRSLRWPRERSPAAREEAGERNSRTAPLPAPRAPPVRSPPTAAGARPRSGSRSDRGARPAFAAGSRRRRSPPRQGPRTQSSPEVRPRARMRGPPRHSRRGPGLRPSSVLRTMLAARDRGPIRRQPSRWFAARRRWSRTRGRRPRGSRLHPGRSRAGVPPAGRRGYARGLP